MLKNIPHKTPILIGLGSGLAVLAAAGIFAFNPRVVDWVERKTPLTVTSAESLAQEKNLPSRVLELSALPKEQRLAELKTIAAHPQPSLERSRARYILARDLLNRFEGGPALRMLEGLDKQYPDLAPYILVEQGRAHELSNDKKQAQALWKNVVATYPTSPASAQALYYLGRYDNQYHEQGIKEFPKHPSTHQIIQEKLKQNPQQPDLWLFLLKNDSLEAGNNSIRDRLVKEFAPTLTPQDWELIAQGYWQSSLYEKAAQAYQNAPPSPERAYRIARDLDIRGKKAEAIAAYKSLARQFPSAPETAQGLLHLSRLAPASEATAYLDLVIKSFPDKAPSALLKKGEILEKQNKDSAARQVYQTLLQKYPTSPETARYRYAAARKYAKAGDYLKAWQWAQPITQNNPDSPEAPKAAFWVGKWAQRLGKSSEAQAAFLHAIARYPQSYYAWRSAVALGWPVGDFKTVRNLSPEVIKLPTRQTPPSGSEAFKELYRLGLDREAWQLFQAEVGDPSKLTLEEQYSLGLLKLSQNSNLEGINLIWSLREREEPGDREKWQALRQNPEYWQALFPFPYEDLILKWSKERKLNPLLVTGLIRQESRFEKDIRSPVGATGLMQVMPDTGKFVAKNSNLKDYSLTDPEDSIRLGTWYFDYTHRKYNNNSLLAVASYNAGPGNVNKWIERFKVQDSDEFVELIPFKETKGYVESVFGNYWNYLRIYNPEVAKLMTQLPAQSQGSIPLMQ
jgi:soluble lytic murein transglycosylase